MRMPVYMMSFWMAPHMRVIGWLTLLLCVWTTGDLVIDLVFEEPDVAADTQATAEAPDNAAEHLLMPSQRAGSGTGVRIVPTFLSNVLLRVDVAHMFSPSPNSQIQIGITQYF